MDDPFRENPLVSVGKSMHDGNRSWNGRCLEHNSLVELRDASRVDDRRPSAHLAFLRLAAL